MEISLWRVNGGIIHFTCRTEHKSRGLRYNVYLHMVKYDVTPLISGGLKKCTVSTVSIPKTFGSNRSTSMLCLGVLRLVNSGSCAGVTLTPVGADS